MMSGVKINFPTLWEKERVGYVWEVVENAFGETSIRSFFADTR